jgi:hypothetical protein
MKDKMKDKRLGTGMLVLLSLLLLSGFVSAANVSANDTIQLYVEVGEKTMVDIQPDQLGWTGVDPGTETTDSQLVGSPDKKPAVQIENIGSTNISYIWFNNSYPDDTPFGSGQPSEYDAGNFVVVRRNNSATYFFPNRVEYNESEIIYLQLPSGSNWAHGRFRSANSEWFWAVNYTAGTDNNCSAGNFRIGKAIHNQSDLGGVDLSGTCEGLTTVGPNPCRAGDLTPTTQAPYTGNNVWGYADLYVGPNLTYTNYTVAVYWNCTNQVKVMFHHWNMDAPGAQSGANGHHMYFSTSTLKPGENVIANVRMRVPYGTAAGNITGALTVTVQAIDVTG